MSKTEEYIASASKNAPVNPGVAITQALLAIEIRLGEIATELLRFNKEKGAMPSTVAVKKGKI